MLKKILLPVDGSGHAWRALDFASDLARQYGATLVILHVYGTGAPPPELREFVEAEHLTGPDLPRQLAERVLDSAEERAREHGVESIERMVGRGEPARAILEVAKSVGADCIVMGSRGLGDLHGLLLGSVSHKVMQLAPMTCVSVR